MIKLLHSKASAFSRTRVLFSPFYAPRNDSQHLCVCPLITTAGPSSALATAPTLMADAAAAAYVRKKYKRWLSQYFEQLQEPSDYAHVAAAKATNWEDEGCVALNVGCGTVCPRELKQLMIDAGCLPPQQQHQKSRAFFYHPNMPFMAIKSKLVTDAASLIAVDCGKWEDPGRALKTLYAIPLVQNMDTGTSNRGARYVVFMRCDIARVLHSTRIPFQREVLGVEDVYDSGGHARETQVQVTDGVRHLRCDAIAEVPGVYRVLEFLSASEHDAIVQELQEGVESSRVATEQLARRVVAHFNRRFIYGINGLGEVGQGVGPLPSFFPWLRDRLQNADAGAVLDPSAYPVPAGEFPCDQLTVNFYDYATSRVGTIAPHVDAHSPFEKFIFLVSLGSYTVMDFVRGDTPEEGASCAAPVGVLLPPRSLIVLSGEARYGWTHGIAERKTDVLSERVPKLTRGLRISLTWRRGRSGVHKKSECEFPLLCDGI